MLLAQTLDVAAQPNGSTEHAEQSDRSSAMWPSLACADVEDVVLRLGIGRHWPADLVAARQS